MLRSLGTTCERRYHRPNGPIAVHPTPATAVEQRRSGSSAGPRAGCGASPHDRKPKQRRRRHGEEHERHDRSLSDRETPDEHQNWHGCADRTNKDRLGPFGSHPGKREGRSRCNDEGTTEQKAEVTEGKEPHQRSRCIASGTSKHHGIECRLDPPCPSVLGMDDRNERRPGNDGPHGRKQRHQATRIDLPEKRPEQQHDWEGDQQQHLRSLERLGCRIDVHRISHSTGRYPPAGPEGSARRPPAQVHALQRRARPTPPVVPGAGLEPARSRSSGF